MMAFEIRSQDQQLYYVAGVWTQPVMFVRQSGVERTFNFDGGDAVAAQGPNFNGSRPRQLAISCASVSAAAKGSRVVSIC